MEFIFSLPILIFIAIAVFGFKAFTVVPQQEAYVVERWGRYYKTLTPGLRWLCRLWTALPTNTR